MATFLTKAQTPTVYRVKRTSSENLGVGWLYNWIIESNLYPGDYTFYRIEGVKKENEATSWSNQSFVTVTFLRATEETEVFTIKANVKILNQGQEICEQLTLQTITVEPQDDNLTCGSITTTDECIYSGIDYEYTFCCEQETPLDEVVFDVRNARVFNLTGDEYFTTNNISVTQFTNNCASIIVRWNVTDPTPPGYKISAWGRKKQLYSEVVTLSNIYAIPSEPEFTIISDDLFAYDSGINNLTLRLNRITKYPDNYKIVIQKRERYTSPDTSWTGWTSIWTGFAIDLKPAYTYDFLTTLTLDNPYVIGDPLGYEVEFKVDIYECSDEFTCDTELICLTSKTLLKQYELIYCPTLIPFGPLVYTTDPCTDEIVWGDISWNYIYCYDSVWSLDSICRVWCIDTIWTLNSICRVWCIDTIWTLNSICRVWCIDTIWTIPYLCRYWCVSPTYSMNVCYLLYDVTVNTEWSILRVKTNTSYSTSPTHI